MVSGHSLYKRLNEGRLMEQVTVSIATNGLKAIVDVYYLPPLSSILDSPHPRPATQTSKV